MQLIEGRKNYLLNLLTVAIPWLERQIVWKLKSRDCLSHCLEYTLDQTLARRSEGMCCLLGRDAPWRSGLPVAVTAQVIGSSAFTQVGLCCVCCWDMVVRAAVAAFFLFLPTQPGCVYHAKGCLPHCSTVTTASVSCLYNLFIVMEGGGVSFERKSQVQRKKDAQKQTKISCSPVVSKTYHEKRNCLWMWTLHKGDVLAAAKGIRWDCTEVFYQACRQKLLMLVACRGFENILHTCVAFPVAVLNCQSCNWMVFMLLRKAQNSKGFLQLLANNVFLVPFSVELL